VHAIHAKSKSGDTVLKPLVSILIPAYNAQEFVADAIQSAIAQTWPRKEIIIVDDGSTDHTGEIAQRFASKDVAVYHTENQGLSAAVNYAYSKCQGDYIQELDSDDLLAPDKIERQLLALRDSDTKKTLLSSPWAFFYYRTRHAQVIRTSLCQDLTPVEWLLRKMGENLHMQNATWLFSRELAEAAGPWDTSLCYDQDGEYFCRVLLASTGTRFVPDTKIFYRVSGWGRISYIGRSDKKKEDSLLKSMKLHVKYLRSLEESERVHQACLRYLQNWYDVFYPQRPDIMAGLHSLAAELHGRLDEPRLRPKYAWMAPIFGHEFARDTQRALPKFKDSLLAGWDKAMHRWETRESRSTSAASTANTLPQDHRGAEGCGATSK
jgi:glycosyltransferase involved in cell wall biosynthesis